MDDVQARLTNCFEAVFPEIPKSDMPHARQDSVESWDSVATITLMNVIEDEFGIQCDLERMAEFTSFDSIRNYLSEILNPAKP